MATLRRIGVLARFSWGLKCLEVVEGVVGIKLEIVGTGDDVLCVSGRQEK